jgi:hypothetical protein
MGDHVLYVMSTVLDAQDNLIDQTEQLLDEIEQVIETVRGIKKTPLLRTGLRRDQSQAAARERLPDLLPSGKKICVRMQGLRPDAIYASETFRRSGRNLAR